VTAPPTAVEIWRVNAFTTTPFTGNPAGVVPRAAGLSDERMQAIAAEINDISETAFVLPPESDDADLRLRFFTSTTEVDLCGHATVSALFVLHWRGDLDGRDGTRTIRAETPVGILELGLEFEDGTFGTTGFHIDSRGLKKGVYSGDYVVWYGKSGFQPGDEVAYLNEYERPLEAVATTD